MNEIMNYDKDVEIIETAILQSQYDAAHSVNEKQLMLYYGIEKCISLNSRKGLLKQRLPRGSVCLFLTSNESSEAGLIPRG